MIKFYYQVAVFELKSWALLYLFFFRHLLHHPSNNHLNQVLGTKKPLLLGEATKKSFTCESLRRPARQSIHKSNPPLSGLGVAPFLLRSVAL